MENLTAQERDEDEGGLQQHEEVESVASEPDFDASRELNEDFEAALAEGNDAGIQRRGRGRQAKLKSRQNLEPVNKHATRSRVRFRQPRF